MTPFPKSFRFSTLVAALALCALASPAVDATSELASGSVKGSLTFDDTTAALTCAAAFVVQKDERKPVIPPPASSLSAATRQTIAELWR
jgi:predicted naringenin-chalcone synthase